MTRRVATVFGGTGFVGRNIVGHLVKEGYRVRVAVRNPETADLLGPRGEVGQIVPLRTDISSEISVEEALDGATLAVNAVGILFEHGRSTFQAIHIDGARRVATAAARRGVARLVHVSAIGADKMSGAGYARSKGLGEEAVLAAFPSATILRPSVVFGPDDGFFNLFAKMADFSPILPVFITDGFRIERSGGLNCGIDLFGSGGPKLQPVFVGDVARAVVAAADRDEVAGRIYQLGGPEVMSLKQIVELVLSARGKKRLLLPVPLAVARVQAAFLQFLPHPPLTPDQVKMLSIPNVVEPGALGLADLGIQPVSAELVVPTYIGPYRAL